MDRLQYGNGDEKELLGGDFKKENTDIGRANGIVGYLGRGMVQW